MSPNPPPPPPVVSSVQSHASQDIYLKYMSAHLTALQKQVAALSKLDKAERKVIGMYNQTKGLAIGMVYDLESLGGAFKTVTKHIQRFFVDMTLGKIVTGGLVKLFKRPITDAFTTLDKFGLAATGLPRATKRGKNLRGNLANILGFEHISKPLTWAKPTQADITGSGRASKALSSVLKVGEAEPPTKAMEATKGMFSKMTKFAGKPVKSLNKNFIKPLGQIAGAGFGLGFQTMFIMGLMQAFAGLFQIFQPVIEVVSLLMERLSVGFIPIVTMLIDIITSPPVLTMIDALAGAMYAFFEIFKPLTPIIISMIGMALMPLMMVLGALTPYLKMFGMIIGVLFAVITPLFELLSGSLAPMFGFLTKILGVLLIAGLYPLVGAMYAIGIVIAGIIDLANWGTTNAIGEWNAMMLPIFGAMGAATGGVLGSFQTGTDYVPYTGVYHLTQGEGVSTVEENRESKRSTPIVINMYGSYLGEDLDDLTNKIAKKLSLYRF